MKDLLREKDGGIKERKSPCSATDGGRCPGDPTSMGCHMTLRPAHLPERNQQQFLWRQGQQYRRQDGCQRWWKEGLLVSYSVDGVIFKHGRDEVADPAGAETSLLEGEI